MSKTNLLRRSAKLTFLVAMALVVVACAVKEQQAVNQPAPSTADVYGSGGLEEILVSAHKVGSQKTRRAQSFVSPHSDRPMALYAPLPAEDRSEYPEYSSNPVKLTEEEPVSTFSVDVDTSSYSIMRSHINRGVLPPKAAVRTEELLNYFSYDYVLPETTEQPFLPQVALIDSPWSDSKQLLRIGIKGYNIKRAEQPDSNLVFLLDVSGSMQAENKLPLVKKSIKLLLKSLKPTDTISLVVYASASGVVLEPTQVKKKAKILAALKQLAAGGSTAGGAGLALAYQLAKENFQKDAVNRIFLATDGDFNVGQRSNQALTQLVESNRKSGVYLSVLGFGGRNYQDDMMQAIAQNGNGTAAYIDTLQEAKKLLVDEATSSLFPIANDVKIQVEFNPLAVAEYRLLGYETRQLAREDFNNDKVDAGDVGAGHSVTAIYEITTTDSDQRSVDPLRYKSQNTVKANSEPKADFNNELAHLKIRYKLPGGIKSKLISLPIQKASIENSEALFAASVVAFAELLKGSKYTGDLDYADVITLAKANKGTDEHGYRAEFIKLVEMAKLLQE